MKGPTGVEWTNLIHLTVIPSCNYPEDHKDSIKYFCKGKCSGKDILVETNGSKTVTQGRYSIEDKVDVFYVTFKNLRKTDSGTYWCGVGRYVPDTFQEVRLTVIDGKPHVSTTLPNLSTTFMASGDISVGPLQRTGLIHLSLAIILSPSDNFNMLLFNSIGYYRQNQLCSTDGHVVMLMI
uniref:Immunoglobulin V-set domain-containing protein n=1 Tax=Hucho hucho TaxID=62062 RepID=A0A4W5KB49_9TELE